MSVWLTRAVRQKVIGFLAAEGLLDEGRLELLDSWKSGHTGFSAHNAVTTDAGTLHDQPARELIRRIYQADPLLCTCGAPMRILSFLTAPPVIRKILDHLESAGSEAARSPPRLELEPQALAS